MLAVLTMIFSLFAMVPAYAKITSDGGTHCEWDETYQYLTFKRKSSSGVQDLWFGGPNNNNNTYYGRVWMVTIKYNSR